MEKNRLEAFSDGVQAIVITIMVLELLVPQGTSPGALQQLRDAFLSYVLSFVFVATYRNNHNHLLDTVHRVTGGMLWANMQLLFQLSVVPFVTRWMGEPLRVGDDWKGTASPLLYVIGIVAASFAPYAAGVIYALAAGLWLVPDKRIERVLMD